MEGVKSSPYRPGITLLLYPPELQRLIREADNLVLTSDGLADPGHLLPIPEKEITGNEVQWSHLKTTVAEEFMKWLKGHKAWQDKINWLTKDVVLESSRLSLPLGTTCVIIPQPFPGECMVGFESEGQEPVWPRWNLPSAAYLLEPGIKIAVMKGKARFYAITFDTPSRP
ncbi:hypothetical protein LZ30DRAFT_736955 [Colletotrichum cereale]|nr:hypothetical protein LZ30DRAFT_736955 [Colletotrichum cereale]